LNNPCGKTTGILNVRNYFHHIRSLDPAAETAGNTLAIHLIKIFNKRANPNGFLPEKTTDTPETKMTLSHEIKFYNREFDVFLKKAVQHRK
jgi:hypothetical protein